jgi:hypothetical protein
MNRGPIIWHRTVTLHCTWHPDKGYGGEMRVYVDGKNETDQSNTTKSSSKGDEHYRTDSTVSVLKDSMYRDAIAKDGNNISIYLY